MIFDCIENREKPRNELIAEKEVLTSGLAHLGDKVIDAIVTKYLYQIYKTPKKYDFKRGRLVSNENLAKITKRLGLHEEIMIYHNIGKKHLTEEWKLATIFEAWIGKIFMEKGFEGAEKIVIEQIFDQED